MDNSSEDKETPSVSSNEGASALNSPDNRAAQPRTFQQIWMSTPLSIVLITVGVALVIWAIYQPESPGWCIGVLAAAAGIMSLRTEGMVPAEKIACIVILVFLTMLELNAIKRADESNNRIRDAQNKHFEEIVEGLKESMQASKTQYGSTIEHVDSVLNQTQSVGALAKENLEIVTGGNSYAFVDPKILSLQAVARLFGKPIPEHTNAPYGFNMSCRNEGNRTLTNVVVVLMYVAREKTKEQPELTFSNNMHPISLGDIPAHEVKGLPDFLDPQLQPNGVAHYIARISAQNGTVEENLFFRHSKDGLSWAYRLSVEKEVGHKIHILKSVDWTEPVMPPGE